ncbi:hypothetical protein, partial [Escherichia coli]|uniref:hypothetical protein n=1 Tax=Escherichia coli TaxID=562 RepID=UPI001BFC01DC
RYFSDTTFLNSNENFSMHPQFLVWCLTFGAQFNPVCVPEMDDAVEGLANGNEPLYYRVR